MLPGSAGPVLPGVPIVVGAPAESLESAGKGVSEMVVAAVATADYPALDPAQVDLFRRLAREKVGAETPPAIDVQNSLADRWQVDAVPALAWLVEAARQRVELAQQAALAKERRLATCLRPWGAAKRVALVVILGLAVVGAGILVGGLMTGLLQLRFFKPLLAPFADPVLTLGVSFGVGAGMAIALLLIQYVTTVAAWGSLGRSKWLFLFVDLSFSGAFTCLRAGHDFWPALAVGLFEASLLSGVSIALGVLDALLGKQAVLAAIYGTARAAWEVERGEFERAAREFGVLRSELAEQVSAVAQREGLVRTKEARVAFGEATGVATAVTETAGLISRATDDMATRTLDTLLTQHITVADADLRATSERRLYR